MKQKLFWFDLALCSLWAIIVLRYYYPGILSVHAVFAILAVVARILASFSLYRNDRKSWLSIVLFFALSAFSMVTGEIGLGVRDLATYPYVVLGVDYDRQMLVFTGCAFAAWLWLFPVVTYIVGLCRKRMRMTMTWKEALGSLLWKDHRARTYFALMLVAVGAFYAGLAMRNFINGFACLVAPTLSYWILLRYYKIPSNKLWLMVVGMLLFFYAQPLAGLWRIAMLAVSFAIVAYMCGRFYRIKRLLALSLIATLYLGILLPSLAIRYNQYTCINYGRSRRGNVDTYQGIFFIKDPNSGEVGLRDRYGLLVKPEYEYIDCHGRDSFFGITDLELHKHGYYLIYNIWDKSISQDDSIDHELQDSVCGILDDHIDNFGYDYYDRLDLQVKDYATGEVIVEVNMGKTGDSPHYYDSQMHLPSDTTALADGEFVSDTLVDYGTWPVLHYSYDVKRDSVALYNIDIKSARDKMPAHEELSGLAMRVARLLNGENE